jgi:hypothetical protein
MTPDFQVLLRKHLDLITYCGGKKYNSPDGLVRMVGYMDAHLAAVRNTVPCWAQHDRLLTNRTG